jgi:predicted DNA-binding mobile mystery protein A
MRERERKLARKRLDIEMRSYRQAGREKNPTNGLLRAVRQALRVPVAEIAGKLGVYRSAVFELEAREPRNTITLRSMSRMAEAMGCKLVYGIVPNYGETFEELAEERLWAGVLGVEKQLSAVSGQRSVVRGKGTGDSCQLSVVSYQRSAVSDQESAGQRVSKSASQQVSKLT